MLDYLSFWLFGLLSSLLRLLGRFLIDLMGLCFRFLSCMVFFDYFLCLMPCWLLNDLLFSYSLLRFDLLNLLRLLLRLISISLRTSWLLMTLCHGHLDGRARLLHRLLNSIPLRLVEILVYIDSLSTLLNLLGCILYFYLLVTLIALLLTIFALFLISSCFDLAYI